jgi:hypothetical protein
MGNGLLLLLALGAPAPIEPPVDGVTFEGKVCRTPNFEVQAPTRRIARRIGEAAERLRKKQARLWLGKELPRWAKRCPIKVTITLQGSGGATSFAFDQGKILSQDMRVEGSLDRILASVLPHEIAHTIFAWHFLVPVPRWADEGGAILAEDAVEHARQEKFARKILANSERAIPLSRLFALKHYPSDVMVLYAQGWSVARFLVERKDRKTFLAFVKEGMNSDWDKAVRIHYGYANVNKLEAAWLQAVRAARVADRRKAALR